MNKNTFSALLIVGAVIIAVFGETDPDTFFLAFAMIMGAVITMN